jgi:hypothetical protein
LEKIQELQTKKPARARRCTGTAGSCRRGNNGEEHGRKLALNHERMLGALMEKEDALSEIASEFRKWWDRSGMATGNDAFELYGWLSTSKSHLPLFRHPGDKRQVVHGRLVRLGLVSD